MLLSKNHRVYFTSCRSEEVPPHQRRTLLPNRPFLRLSKPPVHPSERKNLLAFFLPVPLPAFFPWNIFTMQFFRSTFTMRFAGRRHSRKWVESVVRALFCLLQVCVTPVRTQVVGSCRRQSPALLREARSIS